MNWFQIWTNCEDPLIAKEDWVASHPEMKQFACGHFRELPFVDPIEGEMKGGKPTDYMFFSGRGASPLLVSEPLAKELEKLDHLVRFGTVLPSSLKLRSLWPTHPITIRGGKDSYFFICEVCNRHCYTSMNGSYVLESDLIAAELFGDPAGGLVVSERLLPVFQTRKWSRMKIAKLIVLDKPRDGFAKNLIDTPSEQQRRWTPKNTTPFRSWSDP